MVIITAVCICEIERKHTTVLCRTKIQAYFESSALV